MTMSPKELARKMRNDGWRLERIEGSHYVFKKDGQTEVIPMHGKDMKPGILNAILKRTGLK